ncbi:MAG: 50S ribosomal protein L9 [Chloroflexota bacterium]
MKVLLKEDVEHLGYAGEIHKVANGFGRNYLIPKGFAVPATDASVKQADAWRRKAEARREQIRAEYEALSGRITGTTLNFEAKAGENGRLYGSITTIQITDLLNQTLGTDIDRRKVGNDPLRELGEHKVVVRLSGDFQPEVTVVVADEEAEAAAAAEEATEEAPAGTEEEAVEA